MVKMDEMKINIDLMPVSGNPQESAINFIKILQPLCKVWHMLFYIKFFVIKKKGFGERQEILF